MKKVIALLAAALMVLSLAACGGLTPDGPTKETEETKETEATKATEETTTQDDPGTLPPGAELVDPADFYEVIGGDDGYWSCPAQFYDYNISFGNDAGYYIIMGVRSDNTEDYVIADIESIYYYADTDTVVLNLVEFDGELKDPEFTIDLTRLDDGFIMAPNYYDDNKMVEYYFVEYYRVMKFEFRDEALMEIYYPYLELDNRGGFTYYENIYEGMVYYYGVYKVNGDEIICTVDYTDPYDLSGVKGGDVKEIKFTLNEDGTLTLNTELCYSYKGAILTYVINND